MRKSPLYVLGLNIGMHDSAAALLRDGVPVAMVEQERLSRNKRALGEAPVAATCHCVAAAGITLADVAAVALGSDVRRLREWQRLTPAEAEREPRLDDPERLFPGAIFGAGARPPLVPVKHHLAHASSAFWPSGFDEAAVLVVDNRGESTSTTLASADESGFRIIAEYPVEDSLGLYYRVATEFTGLYKQFGEVGKLMGLAAYGRRTQRVPLAWAGNRPRFGGLQPLSEVRGYELPARRSRQLQSFFETHCFPFAAGVVEEPLAYADFAASIQASLEESLLGVARVLHSETGSANLVIAGGVGLNCAANGRLADEGPFENVFIQPVAHDAGVSLGAALEVTRDLTGSLAERWRQTHAYLGPAISQEEAEAELERAGVVFERLEEDALLSRVAALLRRFAIVGWARGRAEVGPRALGARSILGNPGHRRTLVRMNKLKGREMWRPIAPSVTAEDFDQFFVGTPSPFMLIAARVRDDAIPLLPAVTHVDRSARPQAVLREDNPTFWRLLRLLGKETGVPVVANTSFNRDREPIVSSAVDAVECFMESELDALVVENALAVKSTVANRDDRIRR